MRDEDDTPDDGGDHENDHDHDCEAGSFYEDQYAGDKDAQDARRGSCLLVLLALPAASLLTWLW